MFVVKKPDVAVDALTSNGVEAPAFHVNVLPFAIVATSVSLKLLKDQSPGSRIIVPASTASPHPEKSVAFVTVAPVL